MNLVCVNPDAYTHQLEYDSGMALWRARLSNDEVVIQDDFRPGLTEHSAWKRLATYVEIHDLSIEKLWLQFRSHIEDPLPEKQEGYFFRKSVLGSLDVPDEVFSFYLIGYLTGDSVLVEKWFVPSLEQVSQETRDAKDSGPSLIRNPANARLEAGTT